MEDNPHQSFPCSECQAGLVTRRYVTYFTWIGDELVSVPNFPAWVCDVCGRRDYDRQAILWLNMLLNPEAGKPVSRKQRSNRPPKRIPPILRDSKH